MQKQNLSNKKSKGKVKHRAKHTKNLELFFKLKLDHRELSEQKIELKLNNMKTRVNKYIS